MRHSRYDKAIEVIGLDTSSKDMMVLGALLRAQREPNEFVDFETIRVQLAIDEGGRKGKDPLIYRSLSNLESRGFIEIEEDGRKHRYRSNSQQIQTGVNRSIETRKQELVVEDEEIERSIAAIKSIEPFALAQTLISVAVGRRHSDKPRFAQGLEDVLRLIDETVYRNLKPNDVVRYTAEWTDHPDSLRVRRLERIRELMEEGVKFKALEHRSLTETQISGYKKITESFLKLGFNPELRVKYRGDNTYQFVARNREGIVLIVSENPLSATWVPRGANPDLVDNAIDTFDADFKEGLNISEYGGSSQ